MIQPHPRSAFTLVELMLAIALGILILYVAMAGFRVASQSVTIANRLSLENSLLRAGYFQVEDDLDFWTSLDDPLNTNNQQLRGGNTLPPGWQVATQTSVAGNPFTAMSTLMPANIPPNGGSPERFPNTSIQAGSRLTYGEIKPRPYSSYPTGQSATAVDPWESDVGFDPTVAYSPSDPRTWVRTNMAEKDQGGTGVGSTYPYTSNIFPYGSYTPAATFGRYGLFSNVSSSPIFNNWQIGVTTPFNNQAYAPGGTPPYMVTYSGTVTHTWYPNQVQTFLSALGYEAMFEYLPPNAIYEYYMSYTATPFVYNGGTPYVWTPQANDVSNQWGWNVPMDANGLSRICTQPGWGYGGGFRNWDGGQITACGLYRETYSTSFGYFNPWASIASPDPLGEPGIFLRHYMHFDSDYTAYGPSNPPSMNGGSQGLQDLLLHTAYPQLLLAQSPTYWPAVQCCVGRLIKNDHHVAVAKIIRIDPLTGKISELSFPGLGTTLRGARQQRKPGGGWANWDDQPGISNDPNLDSPTATTPP
jgi:type II secretory pathway pseudopilin PulG